MTLSLDSEGKVDFEATPWSGSKGGCGSMRLKLHYRLLAVVVFFLFTLYLLQRYLSTWHQRHHDSEPSMERKLPDINTQLLDYFRVTDPIDILWTSPQTVEDANTRSNQMLSVSVRSKGEMINWLNMAGKLHHVGLKLNFKNLHVLEPSLHYLYDVTSTIHFPVIVHADVEISGEGEDKDMQSDVLNLPLFLFKLRTSYPNIQFSFGHVPTSTSDALDVKVAETIQGHLRYFNQPVFISICAGVVKSSWSALRWLLKQSDNLNLLVTATEDTDGHCANAPLFDILHVRNDWIKNRVFFNIREPDLVKFRPIAITAGNPLHYFDISDGVKISWAHRVNRKKLLEQALKGRKMFLEADILLNGGGSGREPITPIMAHPPEVSSDLTFEEWLDKAVASGKGLKLDFKSIECVAPSLKLLAAKQRSKELRQPMILNADILPGPNNDHKGINASSFLSQVKDIFPAATLSFGWMTKWVEGSGNQGYTREMVENMNKLTSQLRQPVTFAVRASLVHRSWDHFDWLLKQSRGYTLTIWTVWPLGLTGTESVSKDDMQFVRNKTEPHRVFFDLPNELMPV